MLGRTRGVGSTIQDTMVLQSPKSAQLTPKFIIPIIPFCRSEKSKTHILNCSSTLQLPDTAETPNRGGHHPPGMEPRSAEKHVGGEQPVTP